MAHEQVPGKLTRTGGSMRTRWEEERSFTNGKVADTSRKTYYSLGFTSLMVDELLNAIGDIRGKRVLEIGCGKGWFTRILASRGAEVYAFDISDEAMVLTRRLLEEAGLERSVHLDVMSAEVLGYGDGMFDLVIGNAILHHLDVERSLKQVHRVLAPGGRAVFLEPLGYNPLLNLYRRLTPSLRTSSEEPLKERHFRIAAAIFPRMERRNFYLLALLALPLHFVGWHGLMFRLRDALHRADRRLLARVPVLGNYCWYTLLTLGK